MGRWEGIGRHTQEKDRMGRGNSVTGGSTPTSGLVSSM